MVTIILTSKQALVLPALKLLINRIMQYVLFCVLLLSLVNIPEIHLFFGSCGFFNVAIVCPHCCHIIFQWQSTTIGYLLYFFFSAF